VKPSLRILGGALALAGLSLALTACDTSPYAAQVNSQVIKETALNAEIRAWAGNPTYVSSYDSANSTDNGGSGTTVVGAAAGTFSLPWVASILSGMIESSIIHQHLNSTGKLPDEQMVNASRSVNETSGQEWTEFSSPFRGVLVGRLADEAAASQATVPVATLQQAYQQYIEYFFVQICVLQSTATTNAAAQAISAGGGVNGAPVCYNQAQLEGYPVAFKNAVMQTKVGSVSQPIQSGFGYQVVKVVTRQEQGFNPGVQQVLSLVLSNSQGSGDPSLANLISSARVKVNPAYGTWSSTSGVNPPHVSSS
jgi:PPIC-type PPIASE domain